MTKAEREERRVLLLTSEYASLEAYAFRSAWLASETAGGFDLDELLESAAWAWSDGPVSR